MAEPKEKLDIPLEAGGLSALRTPQGNRVPLGRTKTAKIVSKDIVAELEAAKVEQPRTFIPLRRDAVDHLQNYYPLIRNVDDLKNAPQTLKKSEFGFCPLFCPNFIDDTCQHGLFPMAIDFGSGTYLFTPKLHKERSIALLPQWKPPAGTFKLAKKCVVSFNKGSDYPHVAQMIYDQHGDNWMCAPLRRCFYFMFNHPQEFRTRLVCIAVRLKSDDPSEPGELIAGELGYLVGDIYGSLTGAYTLDGGGSLQLAVTGLLMKKLGVRVWDLGMAMKYKSNALGAEEVPRKRWLELVEKRKTAVSAAAALPGAPPPLDTAALDNVASVANSPATMSLGWLAERDFTFDAAEIYERPLGGPASPALDQAQNDAAFATPTGATRPAQVSIEGNFEQGYTVTTTTTTTGSDAAPQLSKSQLKKQQKLQYRLQKKTAGTTPLQDAPPASDGS